MKRKALKYAFPYTLPICAGFLFLGMSYGFFASSKGFSFIYPLCMSMFIFAGSMEFVTVSLLLASFNPVYSFLLTLMVNARHLFYGISMLNTYKDYKGIKKFYLIYGMCDETFSVNCSITPPPEIDREWFMIWVTLLNQIYWVFGATMGAVLGSVIHFDTTGIEFVMTALFFVMFLDQWEAASRHLPALIGVICSLACLLIFGKSNFMIPAMALIILSFFLCRNRLDDSDKIVKTLEAENNTDTVSKISKTQDSTDITSNPQKIKDNTKSISKIPKTEYSLKNNVENENLLQSTESPNNKINESEENV